MRRKQHAITAGSKVVRGMIKRLVRKQCCAALVIDLYKAFDNVDHSQLKRLQSIELSEQAARWFDNYTAHRSQYCLIKVT